MIINCTTNNGAKHREVALSTAALTAAQTKQTDAKQEKGNGAMRK